MPAADARKASRAARQGPRGASRSRSFWRRRRRMMIRAAADRVGVSRSASCQDVTQVGRAARLASPCHTARGRYVT
eukprot:scaffold2404_cov398-Prasinococcus_capsulatus_cf.AAC.33